MTFSVLLLYNVHSGQRPNFLQWPTWFGLNVDTKEPGTTLVAGSFCLLTDWLGIYCNEILQMYLWWKCLRIFSLKQTLNTGINLRNNLMQHPLFKEAEVKSQRIERLHLGLVLKLCDLSEVKVTQSCPTLATPWTRQSMEFFMPEYWSG